MVASVVTFFFIRQDISGRKAIIWSDALELAAFAVVGCHVAIEFGAPLVVAILMGGLTATGGGVIRDILTQTRPMILSGHLYATVALVGASTYVLLVKLSPLEGGTAGLVAFVVAFCIKAAAIIFNIRMGAAR